MKVTIEYEDDEIFTLIFNGDGKYAPICILYEPYLIKLSTWMDILEGKDLFCNTYGGNGEGGFDIQDGKFIFYAMPSGAGGDVRCSWSADFDEVKEPLTIAINELKEKGLLK